MFCPVISVGCFLGFREMPSSTSTKFTLNSSQTRSLRPTGEAHFSYFSLTCSFFFVMLLWALSNGNLKLKSQNPSLVIFFPSFMRQKEVLKPLLFQSSWYQKLRQKCFITLSTDHISDIFVLRRWITQSTKLFVTCFLIFLYHPTDSIRIHQT